MEQRAGKREVINDVGIAEAHCSWPLGVVMRAPGQGALPDPRPPRPIHAAVVDSS